MNTKTLSGSNPKSDEEYKQEIERMIPEIEAMLNNAGRMTEQARRIGGAWTHWKNAIFVEGFKRL